MGSHSSHGSWFFENTTTINKDSPGGGEWLVLCGWLAYYIQLALAVTLLAFIFIYLRVTSFSQG